MIFRDLCFGEFLREIQNKKLLCIGAGQLFQDMLVLWDDTILRKIIFIADNNKQGHKINVCGNILQVDSVDNILKFCLKARKKDFVTFPSSSFAIFRVT